jgi:hypothetical protein
MRSTQLPRLVDVPLNAGDATSVKRASQGLEESAGQVNGVVVASHALVDGGTGLGDAVVGDGDGLAAVAVGHDAVGQGEDELCQAVVGGAAGAGVGGAGGSVVVGDVTGAGGVLGAGTGVARAGGGAGAGGRSSSGSSRRGRAGRGNSSLDDGSSSGGGSLLGGRRGLLLQSLGSGGGLGSGSGLDGGGGHHGNDGRDSRGLAGVDGGGDIDSLPDDIGDGLPNDGALVDGSREARDGEESASEGKGLGNGGHCVERLVIVAKTVRV